MVIISRVRRIFSITDMVWRGEGGAERSGSYSMTKKFILCASGYDFCLLFL